MPLDPDQDILDLMDAGHANQAVRLMMDRHRTKIYRHVCAELRDQTLADDVSGRVFIEAHRDFRQFSRKSPLLAWLFAITRNRIKDAVKSAKRSATRHAPLDEIDAPDGTSSPAEQLDDASLKNALRRCIEALSPRIREAVLLRSQGYSFEEAATVLDERPGTIQARVARAMPLLRECIEKRTGKPIA